MKPLSALVVCLGCGVALTFGAAGGRSASPRVSVTLVGSGTIIAPQQLDLGFGAGGRLTALDVHQGETVSAGQLLARLDSGSAQAAVQTATANLSSARAQLLDLERGSTALERRQLRVTLVQSRNSLASANVALADALHAARADAVQLLATVTQAGRQLAADRAALAADQTALTSDQATLRSDQATLKSTADRLVAEHATHSDDTAQLLADRRTQADDTAAPAPATALAADAKAILTDEATVAANESDIADGESALGDARAAVSDDEGHINADHQTITSDATRILTDESALTDARNAQSHGEAAERQSIDTARSTRSAALLAVTATASANAVHLAAPRAGQIAAARAAIALARADLTASNEALHETRLFAPFGGTITSVDAMIGQLVPQNGPGILTLTNLATLAVAARFPPAEAGLLQLGQVATITLAPPAKGTLVGHVRSIDLTPAATTSSSPNGAMNDPTAAGPTTGAPTASSDTVIVEIDDHPVSLPPGMQVDVTATRVAALRRDPSSGHG